MTGNMLKVWRFIFLLFKVKKKQMTLAIAKTLRNTNDNGLERGHIVNLWPDLPAVSWTIEIMRSILLALEFPDETFPCMSCSSCYQPSPTLQNIYHLKMTSDRWITKKWPVSQNRKCNIAGTKAEHINSVPHRLITAENVLYRLLCWRQTVMRLFLK